MTYNKHWHCYHCVILCFCIISVVQEVPSPAIISSSGSFDHGSGPDQIMDGNIETHWNPQIPNGQNFNNWYITFELDQRYTVTNVKLRNFGNGSHDITSFKLEGSQDQVTWQKGGVVTDVATGTREWQSFGGFTATGKYLKFTVTQTKSGWQPLLRQIAFIGFPGKYSYI